MDVRAADTAVLDAHDGLVRRGFPDIERLDAQVSGGVYAYRSGGGVAHSPTSLGSGVD